MLQTPARQLFIVVLEVERDVLGHIIQLRGHDEVVLVKTFDLLGLEGHRRIAPAEADIRVMPLGFCEIGGFVHEREGLRKVLEPIGPLNPVRVIVDRPLRHLSMENSNLLRRQWRNPATARGAGLFNEGGDRHKFLLLSAWERNIPAAERLRYSITSRTLRSE